MQETRHQHTIALGRMRPQRGVAMAFVFVLVALLLLIAILVVTGAFNAATQAEAVGIKYGVLNSAEAAANLALNRLAENPSEPNGCVTGTLNGASYRSCMGANNIAGGSSTTATDLATGQSVYVPAHSAYIYGDATNSGNRKVYVEAIAEPAPPLSMPPGAINAVQNVNDLTPMGILQDPTHPMDANIYANNNITLTGSPFTPLQGSTYAVGANALGGTSGSPPVYFPTSVQIAQATQNAKLIAQAGATYAGSTIAGSTATYTGNMYINGDVDISSATVTFASGSDVYINGNLCISGTGALINKDSSQGTLVVSGVVSSSGGGYQVVLPANTMLMVLGADPGSVNPCGSSATDAVSFSTTSGIEPVATVYAANGSISVTGAGTVQGAFDAGANADLGGGTGSAVQYDANQAKTTLATGTMTYTAYDQN